VLLNDSARSGHFKASNRKGVNPDAKVFDVVVDGFLKLKRAEMGVFRLYAGYEPIAQAGNAIFHVHFNGRMSDN